MTSNQFRLALQKLDLTYHTAAIELRMGKWGWQSVGMWARGERPIPGAAQVAIELMLEKKGYSIDELERCEAR